MVKFVNVCLVLRYTCTCTCVPVLRVVSSSLLKVFTHREKLCVAGVVAVTTKCQLVSPGGAINGTLSVTQNELYFEMDDDDEENRKIPQSVSGRSDVINVYL